jgi:hypothetical protein
LKNGRSLVWQGLYQNNFFWNQLIDCFNRTKTLTVLCFSDIA